MGLKIAQLGQPVLWQVAEEVPAEAILTEDFQKFIADMRLTLEEQHGAGLAAPQVFESSRVFLAGVIPPASEGASPGVEVFINPKIIGASEEQSISWEGCLSFPELLVLVQRPRAVRIVYQNAQGEDKQLDLAGFSARVVQHELDHLDGILTIDRTADRRHIIKQSEVEAYMGDVEEDDDEE